ncbi:hypothetical protein [Nocardioides pacificus]
MKFTEREMTVAVEAVARQLYVAKRAPWRRGGADASWDAQAPIDKYNHKAAAGEMVLPALLALPERPTVGATPQFSDEEYAAAAEEAARSMMDHRKPGSWDATGQRQRALIVKANAALTRAAVEAMPLRQDPDALIVPDDLGGL